MRYLLHAAFFAIVAVSVVRMWYLDNPLCPYVIALNLVLAAAYAAGLTFWDRMRGWRAIWLSALLALWLVLMLLAPALVRPACAWCALPLACLAVRVLPGRGHLAVIAGITLVLAATTGFQPDVALPPIAGVWAAAALYRAQVRDTELRESLVEQLSSTRGELARHQREAGVLAERARLAREIHDTLAQDLAAGRTLLQAADREWLALPDQARGRVRTVTEALGGSLVEIRRVLADLNPPALDHDDLSTALAALCTREQDLGTARQVSFQSSGEFRGLPPELAATLLRVAQGALGNVRDHARAHHVTVTLRQTGDEVALQVRDDGAGFAPDRAVAAPARGFGLASMRHRMQAHGGALSVRSTPGNGTTVTGRLPVLAVPR